jgi:hypothetical protein
MVQDIKILCPSFSWILKHIDIPHGFGNVRKWLNRNDFKQQSCDVKMNHRTNFSIVKTLFNVKSIMT